jgi:hypothetical protein
MSGYQGFANTGGYSPEDVQNMRARANSAVTTAYGNTMMNLDRSRALGGVGGSPNYIAAASKVQRELPQQMSDAATNVNATLAQQIAGNKLQALGGMTGAYGANQGAHGSSPWQTALGVAGTVAPFFAMSDINAKEDIHPLGEDSFKSRLEKLPLYTWKYKGEKTTHMGPMAQEFKKIFGVGDGKTIHSSDAIGVFLASAKEAMANGRP